MRPPAHLSRAARGSGFRVQGVCRPGYSACMHACITVYVYIYICVCIYVCIYVYVYFSHLHACMLVYMYVYMNACGVQPS